MKSAASVTGLVLALPALALAASSGCKVALPANLAPGTTTSDLTVESRSVIGTTTQRKYIVHLPANYKASNDVATPLFVVFHGQSQPAFTMDLVSEFSDPALNPNAIVVYPEGLNVQEPGVQWLGIPEAPTSKTIDDRIFVGELLDQLESTLCIDEKRVYASGVSNGGGMTALLMCDPQLNKRFAAFATVVGAFYPDSSLTEPLFQAGCKPALNGRTLPYLDIHGLNDTVIEYDGVSTLPLPSIPVKAWVNSWVERNACAKPTVREVENGTVTESKWKCRGRNDAVVHRAVEGLGHGWPSKRPQLEVFETLRGGPTTWDATAVIVNWFAKWTL